MFNVGIIGASNISHNKLIPAISKSRKLSFWSIFSNDYNRAKFFYKKFNALSPDCPYKDIIKFLSDPELEIVIVTTHDNFHSKFTILAAEYKKHVLVEKPLATNYYDACKMIETCKLNKVKFSVAYHLRWHSGNRKIVKKIHNGFLGDIHYARIKWTYLDTESNWRSDSKYGKWWSLAAVGTHCIDFILWLLTPVSGKIVQFNKINSNHHFLSKHDQINLLSFKFESGTIAEIICSVTFKSKSIVEIYGTKGFAYLDDTISQHGGGKIKTHLGKMSFKKEDPYRKEIEKFALSIKHDKEPEVSGLDALKNLNIMLNTTNGINNRQY